MSSLSVRHCNPFAYVLFSLFCPILFEGFQRTKKIEYLDELINTSRRVLEYPFARFLRFRTLSLLSLYLLTRSVYVPARRTQDLDEVVKLLSQCVNDGHASLPYRFRFACLCASVARRTRHSSVPSAYESAVSLMQHTLLFAPTLQLQHATLTKTSDDFHRMPLDCLGSGRPASTRGSDRDSWKRESLTLVRDSSSSYFSRSTSRGRPGSRTQVCSGQPRP